MSADRERAVIDAFVSVANSLVDSFDIVELLNGLTTDCARLLDVASAGLLLADHKQVLHVMAASSEATRSLELFQIQRDDGPCLDCYRSGTAIVVPDLEAEAWRWPHFAPAAHSAGIRSVHAIPMRLAGTLLGTLGLFGSSVGVLNEDDLALGQGLAQWPASRSLRAKRSPTRTPRLFSSKGRESRVLIEQAKGLLAEQGSLTMEDSFARLRAYARSNNERISDVAKSLVNRSLVGDQVLARSVSSAPDRDS